MSRSSLSKFLPAFLSNKSPVVLYLVGFAALMGGFYLLFSTQFYLDYIFQPVIRANGFLGNLLLNLLGQATTTTGPVISSSAFSITISLGCDGLEAMALYAAAIIAYPVAFRYKAVGLGIGLGFLFLLNLVRIVTLFLTGKYLPEWFDFAHLELWQALFLILTVAAWLIWIRWALTQSKSE